MNFCDLTDKKIVVTGASSGLGRATSILLSRLNAGVCLVARDQERLEATRAAMQDGPHMVLPFDLCEFDAYKDRFATIVAEMGLLHGLVHAAGVRKTQPLRAMNPDSLREIFDINLYAFIELMKGFTRKGVVSPDGASVVALSSVAALRGIPALTGYGASKAALDAAVRSLACELSGKHIRVNSVGPGHVETEMNLKVKETLSPEAYQQIIDEHPLGLGRPEDVANVVAFLLSDETRWMTGAFVPVDGGFTARS